MMIRDGQEASAAVDVICCLSTENLRTTSTAATIDYRLSTSSTGDVNMQHVLSDGGRRQYRFVFSACAPISTSFRQLINGH